MRLATFHPALVRGASRGLTNAQALPAVLAAGLFTCGALMVAQDDTWWHLRCGQLIWATRSVPLTDPFSFALPAGTLWPNHEWLAQLTMYGAYALGGLPLMHLGAGVLMGMTAVLLFGTLRGSPEQRFTLIALVIPWFVAALTARPQVFTMTCMAGALYLIARERYAYLPLLFLFWANLHGAVALGGLVLLGCCVSALLFDRSRLRRLIVVTLLCGGATLFTPLGVHILTFPLESFTRLKQLDLTEWHAPGWSDWSHAYFWVLLAAFLGQLVWRWRAERDWPARRFIVPALLMGVTAVSTARNIPLFLMVAAAAASDLRPVQRNPHDAPARSNTRLAACAWLVALVTTTVALLMPISRLQWQPVSPAALAAIRACPQPTFNTYNVGGYLLWFAPEREVFIDSRQDPYPLDLLTETIRAQQTGDYAALFERFGFRSAVMEPHWPLGRSLLAAGWRETYADGQWLVLERDAEATPLATR